MDPRVEKLAAVLVNYCVGVKPGDWVVIQTGFLAEPLVDACVSEILKAGGNPSAEFSSAEVVETLMREGNDDQLRFISPSVWAVVDQVDARIVIMAPRNTRALSSVDPGRMGIQGQAAGELRATFMRRESEGGYRWTATAFPTEAAAQDAGMSLREYEEFVFGAGLLGEDDPVAAWQAVGERQQRVADWLAQRKTIRITGPGTDLTVGVAGRIWENDDGHKNFPGGEVFTGPQEDITEGVIEFNYPGFLGGQEASGVRLVFEGGAVTEASATAGEAFLRQMLDLDEGAKRLGEFAFGLNPGVQRFTRNTLFDEKIAGTLHMALGQAIPGTGGQNQSALHWDMVYDLRGNGAVVTADDRVFIKDGKIQI